MTAAAHASTSETRPLSKPTATMRAAAKRGPAAYRALTGRDPADARIDTDYEFDAHVLACIIAVATLEDGSLCERIGLRQSDLSDLIDRWFPHTGFDWVDRADAAAEDDELAMVRDLLLANCRPGSEIGRLLAHMIARRSMEASHLWEDLGLRNREELSRLLKRHFAPLAKRNTRGMRWKRFFYRMLCEDEGFVMCTTPVCTDCSDFENCFGVEDGESRLARRKRDAALEANPSPKVMV